MSQVFVHGAGAVTPAGWGLDPFRNALLSGRPIPSKEADRPGWPHRLRTRNVPSPAPKPGFLGHPRLRRSSPIAQYAMSAALEAVGADAKLVASGSLRLGVIFCAMAGCVTYSRRFYEEILKDPATASPLIFPETVFNAPASHLAALLGTTAVNYTLIGDPGTFLQGLALAAEWVLNGRVDGCLVVAAEEMDWLVAEAFHLFESQGIVSDGAGALYLRSIPGDQPPVELKQVTAPCLFSGTQTRTEAAQRARAQLPAFNGGRHVLCDGLQGVAKLDRAEVSAWKDWPGDRLSPKVICGDGLMAGAAWQCIAAVDALRQGDYASATVSVLGINQQAIAAQFARAIPLAGQVPVALSPQSQA